MRAWEAGREPIPANAAAALAAAAPKPLRQAIRDPSFTFVNLFAGIGGFRQAMQEAGGRCVMTSEWNRFAAQTYAANFGVPRDHPFAADIRAVDPASVPGHDVLAAGFPCQPFSKAGVSKRLSMGVPHGFEDRTQGTLFFNVASILAAKRPRAFILENVKNLRVHDKGKTFATIMEVLREDLGYSVSARLMNGNRWVPQNRERIVIVGLRDGPEFDFDTVVVPARGPSLSSILHDPGNPSTWDPFYAPGGDASAYTLPDGIWAWLQRHTEKHRARGNGFKFGLVDPGCQTRTLSARYYKDGSEILLQQPGFNPRRLTPRECARLMGIDSPGLPPSAIPVTRTQAWKQFGNSVVVPMFASVGRALAARLDRPLALAA